MTTEKCCATCSFNGKAAYHDGCKHPTVTQDGLNPRCLGDYRPNSTPSFDYKFWKDAAHGCTCTFTGPRPLEGETMCQKCKDFHARYFPAFPGDPDWHLNHGAVNKNSWGIRPAAIKTRGHERVTDLQLEAAQRAVDKAQRALTVLEVVKEYNI